MIDLEVINELFDLVFDNVKSSDILKCLQYKYPIEYTTDLDTLSWLTAGNIEAGKYLWNTTISNSNPQLSMFKYKNNFWN
jgi:hypothetical protein